MSVLRENAIDRNPSKNMAENTSKTILNKKSVKTALLYTVNAYLVYAVFQLITNPTESLFLNSVSGNSLKIILAIAMIFLGQFMLKESFRNLDYDLVFILLASLYLFLAIIKSPTLLVIAGYILLAMALFFKQYMNESRYAYIPALSLLLTFPKILQLRHHPYNQDLGKLAVDQGSWNYSRLWLIILTITIILCVWAVLFSLGNEQKKRLHKSLKNENYLYLIVASISILYIINLCVALACLVKALMVQTFDIGIFTQMFESMKRDLTPMTTVERDGLLSHFKVHVSPIFYLWLPFYALFDYGETLDVLQALTVFSGVIPLYLILKRMELPTGSRPLILFLFMMTPTLTYAGSYHAHENCFLVPLILWLIYANISEWRIRLVIVTILTLMVKEDAFLYVCVIALFFLLQERFKTDKSKIGLIVLFEIIMPLLYFGIYAKYLSQGVDGSLWTVHYNMLGGGAKEAINTILLNPTYIISGFFTQHKFKYLMPVMLSMMMLPIIQKRWENYVLIIPLLVINLLSDYRYQSELGFQYSYGSTTLLFFMAVLAIEDIYLNMKRKKTVRDYDASLKTICIVLSAIIMSVSLLYNLTSQWYANISAYKYYKEEYDLVHDTLAQIPEDKKVLTHFSYSVDLRKVKELYDIDYHLSGAFDPSVDLVVIPRSTYENDGKGAAYAQNGYTESGLSNWKVLVLEKPNQ